MTTLSLLFVMIVSTGTVGAHRQTNEVSANIVAFDKFAGLTNPREPRQILIMEVRQGSSFKPLQLIKVAYLPKTNGLRGGTTFLQAETLKYGKLLKLKLRKPSRSEELICDTSNFLTTTDGKVDSDENGEPTLRFGSTQFDGDVRFNGLPLMPCLILDSF